MIFNTVMWLLSSAVFLSYAYFITLRQPFKRVAKHFAIFMAFNLGLGVLGIVLGPNLRGHLPDNTHWPAWFHQYAPMLLLLLLKLYFVVAISLMLNFFIAFSRGMVSTMAQFHQTHNSANVHRQPVRFYINRQEMIKGIYQSMFLVGGVFMLWAVWFRMGFPT